MALHLARRNQRVPSNPSLIKLFSTSSSDPPPQDGDASPPPPPQQPQQQNLRSFSLFNSKNQNPAPSQFSGKQSAGASTSLLDIKKNLAEFRRRSAEPPRDSSVTSQSQPQISFQELYKRNVAANSGDSSVNPGPQKVGDMGFDAIRISLKQLSSRSNASNRSEKKGFLFSGYENHLNLKPDDNVRSNVIGGASALPISVFGKEMEERKEKKGETEEMKTEFVKNYSADELGEKLRLLRPGQKKEEGWFSLQELNERLIKLKQWEEEQTKNTVTGFNFKDLRASLQKSREEEEKKKRDSMQGLNLLNLLDGTPKFMSSPPKEHLMDTYYHPDNMSSAEKMKVELAKVREEFKQSESDCGSARVQVAQLTVKIKHLSSVLHKKDKHSKKGLLGMVQRRKKLLRYMRRTDWDSYCLCLSKLHLRDNPDYKS